MRLARVGGISAAPAYLWCLKLSTIAPTRLSVAAANWIRLWKLPLGVPMSVFRPDDPQWQRHLVLGDDWRIFIRPLRPDDDLRDRDLLAHVSREDLRLRFFDSIKEFSTEFIARLTQLDYARAMAFIAIDEVSRETLGVVRLHIDPGQEAGEYAVLLRSDLKGRGLGWALMQLIIEYAKFAGLRRIYGEILRENSVMLKMCRELGFTVTPDAEDHGVYDVALVLDSNPQV
jgi:RimJ/RimL family protein N-acetyltransferase